MFTSLKSKLFGLSALALAFTMGSAYSLDIAPANASASIGGTTTVRSDDGKVYDTDVKNQLGSWNRKHQGVQAPSATPAQENNSGIVYQNTENKLGNWNREQQGVEAPSATPAREDNSGIIFENVKNQLGQ